MRRRSPTVPLTLGALALFATACTSPRIESGRPMQASAGGDADSPASPTPPLDAGFGFALADASTHPRASTDAVTSCAAEIHKADRIPLDLVLPDRFRGPSCRPCHPGA
jgi:hypothetical protein